MNKQFMTNERKYLFIIGGILLVAAVLYRFYPWGFELTKEESSFELKQKKIAKYISIVHQKPMIEKQIKYLNNLYNSSSKIFLGGNTPALAAVDIQNTLSSIADKVDLSIKRIDILKEKKIKGEQLISIPVKFNIDSTTRQLRDMLFYIESSEKLIRIIDIQSNVRSIKYPELITSAITVEGFIHE